MPPLAAATSANTGAPVVDVNVYRRVANAVATLAFGFTGSLAGLMAFRASASGDAHGSG